MATSDGYEAGIFRERAVGPVSDVRDEPFARRQGGRPGEAHSLAAVGDVRRDIHSAGDAPREESVFRHLDQQFIVLHNGDVHAGRVAQ